jgi:hypothetical protein
MISLLNGALINGIPGLHRFRIDGAGKVCFTPSLIPTFSPRRRRNAHCILAISSGGMGRGINRTLGIVLGDILSRERGHR